MGGAKPWETSNHALTQLSHAPVFCDHAPSPQNPQVLVTPFLTTPPVLEPRPLPIKPLPTCCGHAPF